MWRAILTKRRLFNVFAAASLAVLLATSLFWLVHLLRKEFVFGVPRYLRITSRVNLYQGMRSGHGQPFAGYALDVERPMPTVSGPTYMTPEYLQWQRQFHQWDRHFEFAGFETWRWAIISFYPDRNNATEFISYEYGFDVPFWFVCAASAPAPAVWLCRRLRLRRRARAGLCLHCGYDLRATPARCPECGTVPPPPPPSSPPDSAAAHRERRQRKRLRRLMSLWAIAAGLWFILRWQDWTIDGLPAPWLGYLLLAIGLLSLLGLNLFRGGPLDPRLDPPDKPDAAA